MSLKKELRPIDVWGLALGAIIGWGCFVLPGNSFLPKAGPLGMALGMLIGALLIIVISISYGYLINKYPVSGGEFVYANSALGKKHAFICGWFIILAYWSLIPLNGTAIGMIGRYLFPGVIQKGMLYSVAGWEVYAGEIAVASLFIIILGYINIKGIKGAGWIQTAVSLILIGAIASVTAVVFSKGVDFSNLSPGFSTNENKSTFSCIFAIVAIAPFAFIGFDCIPQAAEEYKFSHKKALFIMISAILVAAVLYICVNTVTAIVMPWEEMINSNPFWATGKAIEIVMGKLGLALIGVAMFCAVLSGINAFYISSSRLIYAMSKADALPKWFGELDPKYGTPKNAILFIMVLSLVAPWFGREVLGWIVDMTSVGGAMAFAYTTASAAIIAKRTNDKGQSIIGIIGCIMSLFFLSLLIVPGMPGFLSKEAFIMLGIWIILGIGFYYRIKFKYLKSTKIDEMMAEI